MQLTQICIKRPIFTTVISLVLITLGAMFYTKLQVRDKPNVNSPVLTIRAHYEGADALYMERKVTTPIERYLKTIKNLETITSDSQAESSRITLHFKIDADIEIALNDVRSEIAKMSYIFPNDMKLPSVSKTDSSSKASIYISATSNKYDNLELTRILETQVKSVLEKLPTVGSVQINGSKYYLMEIDPIGVKMYQFKISPLEIEKAIKSQNHDYPAGAITTNSRSFSLRLNASLSSVSDFENIIIKKNDDGSILKLRDIANVNIVESEEFGIMRCKGKRGLALAIVRQSTANDIELSNNVKYELEKIKKSLPPEINIEIGYDGSLHIRESIKSVFSAIVEAIILVGLVIFLFLGSFKLTLIPLVTIPISLIGTFTAMYFMGFSINFFTLLAMILAIGLVVDDAIVMLENIFRHKNELGKSPKQASADASKEISFAIIVMTITLAAVFLPVGFIEGTTGKMFMEFAWTLAFCIGLSGVVALTLTPMMASSMLSIKDNENNKPKFFRILDAKIHYLQDCYVRALQFLLKKKKIFFCICSFSIILLILGFKYVDKTFMPKEDIGIIMVQTSTPEGTNIYETEKSVLEIEKFFEEEKDVNVYFSWIWGNSAFSFVPLKEWNKRKRNQFAIMQDFNKNFSNISSASAFAFNPMGGGGKGSGSKVEFNIQSSLDYPELDLLSTQIMNDLKKDPAFRIVERDFFTSNPTFDIIINREKAHRYGVSIDNIGKTIQYLIAGKNVGDFRIGSEVYDVVLRFKKSKRSTPESVKNIFIKTSANYMIPLESVVDVVEKNTVKSYNHYNNARSITITADLNQKTTLRDAIKSIDTVVEKIIDPSSTKIEYLGSVKDMNSSSKSTMITFLLALIFIFLVLAAQFESFGDSLLILVAVPFSITGGILGLWIFGDTLNMYSNIGMITLIGLVTKNSIMIVEFANQLKESGYKVNDAILEASKLRLRPILMTSIATIFGAVPLVFASGAGAGSRHSIGIVVFCGMILGTLFTIFVIPILYQTFKRDS